MGQAALKVLDGAHSKNTKALSILGDGCSFNGKMLLHGDVRIAGNIEGIIISHGMLVIEETACIKGEIRGTNLQMNGKVEGNITMSGLLVVSPKGNISGDISVSRLIVEDGGKINGRVSILDSEKNRTLKPVTKPPNGEEVRH